MKCLGYYSFLALVTNLVSQEIIGVNYSFGEDFYWNFNDKRCENKNKWLLVDYKDVGVVPPNKDSSSAILATANSCTSSFHLVFFPDSKFELCVYTKIFSKNSRIIVQVVNEDNKAILKYIYSRSNKDYVNGWRLLTIPIQKNLKGYINLKGYSLHDEIIVIDSFKYTPNTTNTKQEDNDEVEDERTFLMFDHRREVSDKGSQDIEGSGDDIQDIFDNEGSGEDIGEIDIIEPIIDEENSGLGPWIITLIVIGVVVVLSLIAVGSYHLGKLKGQKDYPIFIHDGEPPRVLRIPRVRGTLGSSTLSRWHF